MGIDRTDYLMWAVDVGADAFDWDKHEAILDSGEPFQIVYDGMSGKYCMVGHVIAKADPYEGLDRTEIDPREIGKDHAELAAQIAKAFDRPDITTDSFKLILFSHFS